MGSPQPSCAYVYIYIWIYTRGACSAHPFSGLGEGQSGAANITLQLWDAVTCDSCRRCNAGNGFRDAAMIVGSIHLLTLREPFPPSFSSLRSFVVFLISCVLCYTK